MTRSDDPVTHYELGLLRADFVDRLSAQDIRINQSLNEATECVVEAKDAAKMASENRNETKEVAREVRQLLIDFKEMCAAQSERLKHGTERFQALERQLENKQSECKTHLSETVALTHAVKEFATIKIRLDNGIKTFKTMQDEIDSLKGPGKRWWPVGVVGALMLFREFLSFYSKG